MKYWEGKGSSGGDGMYWWDGFLILAFLKSVVVFLTFLRLIGKDYGITEQKG